MAKPPIDFWFAIGSTYTYLSVMRIADVEKATGAAFNWRPFSLRTLTREMNNVPFATKPFKASYMWRDVERRAAMYGFPAQVPAPYPLKNFDLANQVATVGIREGWGKDYVRATYKRWFQMSQEPGEDPNLTASLQVVGQDAARVLTLAASPEMISVYKESTDAARKDGVFGSPTFTTSRELFWGDDRLEDAVSWHLYGAVQRDPILTTEE